MSDNMLTLVCIGGVLVAAVLIIVIANWANNRFIRKRSEKMKRDIANGTYDPKKKYFGDQGNWEPGEGASDGTDWNTYNRH